MLGQYDFDKIYSLDVFNDIASNPPSIPVLTQTVFNFEYVYSTLFGTKTIQDLFGSSTHCFNFDKAIDISKKIAELNPNKYTDVRQFTDNRTRMDIITLSQQGYELINGTLLKYIAGYKPNCCCYYDGHISKITSPITSLTKSDINETLVLMHCPKPYPGSYSSPSCDVICPMKNAYLDKLHVLNYCIRNDQYREFIKQYIDNFETCSSELTPQVSALTETVNKLNTRIEEQRYLHCECDLIREIVQIMSELPCTVFDFLNNEYWRKSNNNTEDSRMAYFLYCYDILQYRKIPNRPYREDERVFGEPYPYIAKNMRDQFYKLNLVAPETPWKEQTTKYIEEIQHNANECQKILETNKPSFQDPICILKSKNELARGKHNIIRQLILQTTLKHQASLLRDLVSKHLPPTIEEKLEAAILERDEARSQVASLEAQMAELRRQLAAVTVNAELQAELDRQREANAALQAQLDTERACRETDRQNLITVHRAYDDKCAENQSIKTELQSLKTDLKSVIGHWIESTSS